MEEKPVIRYNKKQNGIEVCHQHKPGELVLLWLRENKFSWSRFNQCWYIRYSDEQWKMVHEYFGIEAGVISEEDKKPDNEKESGLYIRMMRSARKKAYAKAYIDWIKAGRQEGKEPDYEPLSFMAAQTVRKTLNVFYPVPAELKPAPKLEDIANKHGMALSDLRPSLATGINIEFEHTRDVKTAEMIALQHLDENPRYYEDPKPENWAEKELEKEAAIKNIESDQASQEVDQEIKDERTETTTQEIYNEFRKFKSENIDILEGGSDKSQFTLFIEHNYPELKGIAGNIYDQNYISEPGSEFPKELLREQDGLKIYLVDGEKVRKDHIEFVSGGHGYVYDWIPRDEIWIDDNQKSKPDDMEATIKHEVFEVRKMRDEGLSYEQAHELANDMEKEVRSEEKPIKKKLNPYIALYKGKKHELYAETKYKAQLQAAEFFKAKKSYEVDVYLAEEEEPKTGTELIEKGQQSQILDIFLPKIKIIKPFISQSQLDALVSMYRSEEKEAAIEIAERLSMIIITMPEAYETDDIPANDKIVHLHYFHGGSDWYIVEKDKGEEQLQMFGYAILNEDLENAEWGYVSAEELKENNIELDFYWEPKKFSEVKRKWEGAEEPAIDEKQKLADEIKSLEQNIRNGEKLMKNPHFTGDVTMDLEKDRKRLEEKKKEFAEKFGEIDLVEGLELGIIKPAQLAVSIDPGAYSNAYELNKGIERLLDSKWNDSPDQWSVDELQFITGYTGYGGLAEEMMKAEVKLGANVLFEFFTPELVIEKMWGLAHKFGYKDGPVLEPSLGIGLFFNRKYVSNLVEKTGYEINKYSARIAKLLYPEANINDGKDVKYFEQLFIVKNYTVRNKVTPRYSLVIGNPPYGAFEGEFAGMGEKSYTHAKNYIDYFILRGLDVLVKDGLLVYIIGAEVAAGGVPFLDQGTNKAKEMIMERGKLIDAYRLPEGIFERTGVTSDIVVFRKR